MINYNNYNRVSYYCKYDYINKYNIKNVFQISKLSRISFNLPLNQFFNSKSEKQSYTYNLVFLLLFFSTSQIPYIKAKKAAVSKDKKESEISYSFSAILSTSNSMYSFLVNFLLEGLTKYIKNQLNVIHLNRSSEKLVLLSIKLPISSLPINRTSLQTYNLDVFAEDIFIDINFIYKNINYIKEKRFLLKNLPFFWIND